MLWHASEMPVRATQLRLNPFPLQRLYATRTLPSPRAPDALTARAGGQRACRERPRGTRPPEPRCRQPPTRSSPASPSAAARGLGSDVSARSLPQVGRSRMGIPPSARRHEPCAHPASAVSDAEPAHASYSAFLLLLLFLLFCLGFFNVSMDRISSQYTELALFSSRTGKLGFAKLLYRVIKFFGLNLNDCSTASLQL